MQIKVKSFTTIMETDNDLFTSLCILLVAFVAEIFNNTTSEILHRAHQRWCEELSVASDSSGDP